MNNRCDSERYANSETNLRDNYSLSSPKKLQIRIQTLKMENENLLKNLAIWSSNNYNLTFKILDQRSSYHKSIYLILTLFYKFSLEICIIKGSVNLYFS